MWPLVRRMLPFSQHPGRHRSQILHDGRLDRVDELGSEVLRHLHQQRLVDQVPLGAVRHRVPAIVQMPDQTFGADRGREPAEEKPSRLERPPAAVQHRVEVIVVSREVQDGVDDDDVGEEIRERVCFDGFDAEVVSRQVRREAAHGVDRLRIEIGAEDLVPFAEQVHDVPAGAAAGVEDRHPLRDIAAQELIEEVDVDVAKLFLESGHAGLMVAENGGTAVVFRRRG